MKFVINACNFATILNRKYNVSVRVENRGDEGRNVELMMKKGQKKLLGVQLYLYHRTRLRKLEI